MTLQLDPAVDRKAREIGLRQSLFRDVNEHIERVAGRFDLAVEVPIICECGDTYCSERLTLSRAEYEAIRRFPTRFAVLPGHALLDVERVVGGNGAYLVVEKFGEGALVAVRLDPRRPRRRAPLQPGQHRAQVGSFV